MDENQKSQHKILLKHMWKLINVLQNIIMLYFMALGFVFS